MDRVFDLEKRTTNTNALNKVTEDNICVIARSAFCDEAIP